MSFKIVLITQKLFMNTIKLPFKPYFLRQYFYLGNLLIIFDSKQAAQSEQVKKAVNYLQADI